MNDSTITVNGRPRALRSRSVEELVEELDLAGGRRGVAVAVNGEVVPRSEWPHRELGPGDTVELVGAVQGG